MGPIDKLFVGMDIVDGVGKVKNTYKSSANNKYDNILGTKPIKTTNMLGMNNAVNGKINNQKREMLASENLDNMIKIAGIDDFLRGAKSKKDDFNKHKNNAKNKINGNVNDFKNKTGLNKVTKERISKVKSDIINGYNSFKNGVGADFNNASKEMNKSKKRIKNTVVNIANGRYSSGSSVAKANMAFARNNFKNGAKSFGKGLVKSTPAIAGIGGIGYGAYRAMKHFEDKKPVRDRNDLYPKAVGATIGGALAVNALIKKNPYKAFDIVSKSVGKVTKRIPENAIRSTGPVGGFFVDVAKGAKKETGKIVNEGVRKTKNKKIYKKASEELDFFLEKNAKVYNVKKFTKDVLKENVLKGGAESVFYFGVPSAISYAIGRDFRRGGTKIKKDGNHKNMNTIVIDVPLEKKALEVNISPKTENIIRRSADGIGRVFIPGAVSAVIGRNIMDNMKKVDDSNDEISVAINKELPKDKARVIIQTNNNNLNKKADEVTNNMIKASDIVDALHSENLNNLGKKKTPKSDIRLYRGIKKKGKMFS